MAVATGTYTGSGSAKTVNTGLANIRGLHIIRPKSGKSMIAYTVDVLPGIAGVGAFMQNSTPATGIAIQSGGVFVVSHTNWIVNGEKYAWEARS
ncbi:MAG: hypothetical protein JXB32_24290 [Deltaproteobacteria bacterium]|nr:hypothetical protein [Deltaproteobacteria bacterium]